MDGRMPGVFPVSINPGSPDITASPTLQDARDFDLDLAMRQVELSTHVLADWRAEGGVWIAPDEAGVGKTTSLSIGLLGHPDPAAFLCERHEKAAENKFADYYHAKGRKQPGMCPVYELSESDPIRETFERLDRVVPHRDVHRRVDGIPNECPYLDSRNERDEHTHIVGVHHQLREFSNRPTVIDETPTLEMFETKWSTADLTRTAKVLRRIPDAEWLSDWVDEIRKDIATSEEVDINIEPPERSITAEQLSELKIEFNEWVIEQIIPVEPCFDAILGALATVGFHPEACCAAIDGPDTLEFCPRCYAPTTGDPPACMSTVCNWDMERMDILDYFRDSYSRVAAYAGGEDGDKLVYSEMPAVDDLPNDVLILDATPQPKIVGALFGVDPEDIIVADGPDFEPNMHLTEISDGAYPGYTIENSGTARKRMQRAIDHVNRKHEHVFYAVKRGVMHHFDFPEEGSIVRYYGNLRGMDINEEWDDHSDMAVCIVGAPGADMRKVRHIARALGHPEGGEEITEIRTIEVDGESVEVETKAFTGLDGEIYQDSCENEIVQAMHRVRPILADETVHVYKLTNVPTRLPVDERLTWAEFLNEGLPARGVRELVGPLCESFDREHVVTSMSEIYGIVGVEDDAGKRRVRRWVGKLTDSGATDIDGYASDSSHRVIVDVARLREIA